jgi:hypothetical protein
MSVSTIVGHPGDAAAHAMPPGLSERLLGLKRCESKGLQASLVRATVVCVAPSFRRTSVSAAWLRSHFLGRVTRLIDRTSCPA